MTEAIATMVAGVFGGVSQTTPYIGHPAYKDMGGRAAYTLATGLFIGLGGMLGYIPFMAMILPIACLAPILIFVGFDIVSQSFKECPARHSAAVTLAMLPSLAQLLLIIMSNANGALAAATLDPARAATEAHVSETFAVQAATFFTLAHGFILTGMLWGAALAFLIDRRFTAVVVSLGAASVLSLFGVIHSVLPSGGIYLPWSADLLGSRTPYQWAAGYAATAAMIWLLAATNSGFRIQNGAMRTEHAL